MAKIEKKNEFTVIWNDEGTVGLQFTEGKSMQLYDKSVLTDFDKLEKKGIDWIEKEIQGLEEFAKDTYPMEFAEMP